jgi:hypothetical protein
VAIHSLFRSFFPIVSFPIFLPHLRFGPSCYFRRPQRAWYFCVYVQSLCLLDEFFFFSCNCVHFEREKD